MKSLYTLLSTFLIVPGVLFAQSTASVDGRVIDPSGAVIPGASVKVIDPAGRVVTETSTDAAGRFEIPTLESGTLYHWRGGRGV